MTYQITHHTDGTATVTLPAEPGFARVDIRCGDDWVARMVRRVLDSQAWDCVRDAQRLATELNRVRELEEIA